MTQEEKIKELEQRIALMDADNSALCADLAHWKKVAAGLRGANKKLVIQVEHYKTLEREGDELNEKRIAMLEEKERVITGLQQQVNKLSNIIAKNTKEANLMKSELESLRNKKPWYKKIF